ncbi:MAG: methyl-accepting chemotaxis protein [Saccharospirillaceae bacterium]|nr:methyl-accepting chemotaxis protein [Pseudomonadales bacterium]NRB80597.1 methyl-accepting chemotaxis protein [Saccharospirillaceae bacterium]
MNFFSDSLLGKFLIPIIVVFVLTLIILSSFFKNEVRKNAEKTALPNAISTVQQYKIIRGYYTKNVVQKVLNGSDLKPHFDHKQNANQIPLPATFIHDISEEFAKQGMTLKLYSAFPFPNRKDRKMDEFGQLAWDALNKNPDQVFSKVETINDKQVVRVAVADTMVAEGCVNCHNSHASTPKTGWKLGDVRGVLEVQVAIDQQVALGADLNNKIMLFLIATFIILLLIILYILKRQVISRLLNVSNSLDSITDGDNNLSQRIDIDNNDEIAKISIAFNRFVSRFDQSIINIKSEMGQLVSTSKDLTLIARTTEKSSHNQETEINQVAVTMNEMNNITTEVARLSIETAQHTEHTEKEAEKGKNLIERNHKSIEELTIKMKETAQSVSTLEGDTQNIGSVLDVIRGIAEQTNLLALNAAIEAARAGEQGRGFAVVADEVRTLASRTQESTEEINQMIKQLQDGAKVAVSTMEQSNQSLENSLSLSTEINELIQNIVQETNDVGSLNYKIESASSEQNKLSEEINKNLSNISNAASQNNDSIQNLQKSVTQIGQTMQTVNEQISGF